MQQFDSNDLLLNTDDFDLSKPSRPTKLSDAIKFFAGFFVFIFKIAIKP